jgi:hypothetical protein
MFTDAKVSFAVTIAPAQAAGHQAIRNAEYLKIE